MGANKKQALQFILTKPHNAHNQISTERYFPLMESIVSEHAKPFISLTCVSAIDCCRACMAATSRVNLNFGRRLKVSIVLTFRKDEPVWVDMMRLT